MSNILAPPPSPQFEAEKPQQLCAYVLHNHVPDVVSDLFNVKDSGGASACAPSR